MSNLLLRSCKVIVMLLQWKTLVKKLTRIFGAAIFLLVFGQTDPAAKDCNNDPQ